MSTSTTHKKLSGEICIYIDNSDLLIQGQIAYARKKRLESWSDPTWRFDVGRLKDILLGNSELRADEKRFEPRFNLYGSEPPPVDSVWRALKSHNINVNLFARSSWTKREKQVDAELIADLVAQASKAYYLQIPTVFIIVSGDQDINTAVEKITSDFGHRVHVWSWKDGLSDVYKRHEEKRDLVQVHLLDDYLDYIGFCETTWKADRNVISPYSIVVLDPLPKSKEIEEFLSRFPAPAYKYESVPKRAQAASQDLVIIPAYAWTMKPDALNGLFMKAKAQLESHGLVVLTYLEYSQRYLGNSRSEVPLAASNRFEELLNQGEDVEDDGDSDEDRRDDDNGDTDDGFVEADQGFEKRKTWLKNNEEKLRNRCNWKQYCSKGKQCKFGHTKEEEARFETYGITRAIKYKPCRTQNCLRGSRCSFAHGKAELFCPTCDTRGDHQMSDCPERYPRPGTRQQVQALAAPAVEQIKTGWEAKPVAHLLPRKTYVRLMASASSQLRWSNAAKRQRFLHICTGDEDEDRKQYIFYITLNEHKEYEILDGSLGRIASLPTISLDIPRASDRVMDILQHLAISKCFEGVENPIPDASLEGSFALFPTKRARASGIFDVRDGDTWGFRVENLGYRPLYLAVFKIAPTWHITNLLLQAGLGECDFAVVEPKGENGSGKTEIRLKMQVSELLRSRGEKRCQDIVKIFITSEPTSFPSVVLPELSLHTETPDRVARGGDDQLLKFFLALATPQKEWATRNFIICTVTDGEDNMSAQGSLRMQLVNSVNSILIEHSDGYSAPTAGIDSGYGSASKASDQAEGLSGEALSNCAASDNTDNLSIDLSIPLQNEYIGLFSEKLADAVFLQPLEATPSIPSIHDLPELLRVFSLKLSMSEGPGLSRRAGNFARKHKE